MAIQTGSGALRIDPDDAQITYRGKTIALKIRSVMWPQIMGCVKQSDGTWVAARDLTDDIFSSDIPGEPDPVAYWLKQEGSALNFVRNRVLPTLNAWLAELFTPSSEPVPALEQINAALSAVRFLPQPDGTLIASA